MSPPLFECCGDQSDVNGARGALRQILSMCDDGELDGILASHAQMGRRDPVAGEYESEPDGPDELHVVIVDNGRTNLLGTELAEILYCIRCGACLNTCPVYQNVGGHAYGAVYTGPVHKPREKGLWWLFL